MSPDALLQQQCKIEQRLGRAEACQRDACPLWARDEGGAEETCMFETLDLEARKDLAQWLHNLRAWLENPN